MNNDNSVIMDLSSVDKVFSQIYIETGLNPIPNVCDNQNVEIFKLENKQLKLKFINILNNSKELIKLLDIEITRENEKFISKVNDNLMQRVDLISIEANHFDSSEYCFKDLYIRLKKIQNQLGISISSKVMNVLVLADEDVDLIEIKNKILSYIGAVRDFMLIGAKNNRLFMGMKDKTEEEEFNYDIKQKKSTIPNDLDRSM